MPQWYEQETDDRGIAVWRHRSIADEGALGDVYRDETLVTALDPMTAQRVADDAWTGVPASSGTLPSLMAGMLEELTVEAGHRVLEVGTGTGYNAALLCARLGDELVHSMDVDQALVDVARQRLASVGYEPQLLPGDGTQGYPTGGPFDRIIATCSVPSVPTAWIQQLRPGGILVTDVALGIEGGLVRLSVGADGRARGFFTTTAGRFMAARSEARTNPSPERPERPPATGPRPTGLTAAEIRANYPLRLVLAFQLPGTELVYYVDDKTGATALQLQRGDGSWARVPLTGDDQDRVTFGGDEGLWKQAEEAWAWWNSVGRPAQDRFGYARETDGSTHVWHLHDGTRWNLPI
ncbi:methyltransferase domain-containing protein [Streptomyces monashensis]|uniref:methyltransferase domain-containing protein n=1 Tax=Streptomyces monashensis TaxID=1678012 RepID=UPI001FEB9D17|nr:methyltransferase domain-containing protein [Streptomyces monashensis]